MNRNISVILCALALFGCKRSESGAPRVAFLLSTLQEERYQKDMAYFEAHAKSKGLEVTTLAADNDNARQLAQVEDALTKGAKVLVVQPTDSRAASSYVRLAHEAGAKIIAYDRAIESAELDYYVAHDSRQVGVLQAQAAVSQTNGKGQFVVLNGQAGHSVALEIRRGYQSVLQPYLDRGDIRIVAEQSHSSWSPEQALRTVEDAISRTGGDIVAILAQNSGMARGAVQAVESAGLKDVFIAGADADAANVNYVCGGRQSVEIVKDVKPLAERAAEIAADLAQGRDVSVQGHLVIDGAKVPTISVRVALVTKESVKRVVVDSGFLSQGSLSACAGVLAQAPGGP